MNSLTTCPRPRFVPHLLPSLFAEPAPRVLTTPPSLNLFAPPVRFLYQAEPAEYSAVLDRSDRVIDLSDTWNDFAPPLFRRRDILGQNVARFIGDATVGECIRMLFELVRKEDRTAKILTRCDRRSLPRASQVTFRPLDNGVIEVTWSLLEGPRAREIAPVQRRQFHDGEYLRMCSWCRNVHTHTTWQRLDVAAPALGLLGHETLPPITHGICPACRAALAAEDAERLALPIAV